MNTEILRSLALAIAALSPVLSFAQWVAKGSDAMFTIYLPQGKKPDTNALFIISYEKRWSCLPAVSVMLMSSRKLGTPVSQETFKKRADLLSIEIDGRSFSGETKQTIYSNAMELAMIAPVGLVEALNKQPTTVIARLGEGLGGFDFSDGKGFSTANAAASANCN